MGSFKHLFRRLGRAPVFTAIALLTLALGIGANTAIFSVVNGVLLKPLPFPESERLVGVWHSAPGIPSFKGPINLCPSMFYTYRGENRTFERIGLWSQGGASITGNAEPEQVPALYFTHGVLETLRVPMYAGRTFTEADDTPGTPETVILTYGYWQRRFGGKPVVGRPLEIDSKQRTIIGVLPKDFRFLDIDADMVFPERFDRAKLMLGNFSYQGIARLKPGVTLQQASADVNRMIGIWLYAWPPPPSITRALFESARFSSKLQPLKQEVVGEISTMLWVLMGTIGIVLLIACANVASLMLVRAEGRQQELAIRAALGAGWGTIARELLLESLTLAVMGGGLGLGLAYAGLRLLKAVEPQIPRLAEITIDPIVLAFTLGVSLFAGVLFGCIPVWKYARAQVASVLRAGGRSLSQGRERHRARNVLVVVQVGLALVLLIGSGLMIRTFQALRDVDPGFRHPELLQLVHISVPNGLVKDPEVVMRIQSQMTEKIAAIPGVERVAFAAGVPLDNSNSNDILFAEDKVYKDAEVPPIRRFNFITPGYLDTMGMRLVGGRDFTWTDLFDKRPVALVSSAMAREMWGSDRAALGKRIRANAKSPWREIVGVVNDVHESDMAEKPRTAVYWPALTAAFWEDDSRATRYGAFVIRSKRAGTESLLADVRQAIWSVRANLPVFRIHTMKSMYDKSMARTSFTLAMLGIAGVMALLLAVIGLYGVIAYAVTQRTREIGIRTALGARPAELQRMFLGQGMILAGIGTLIGLVASYGLTRLMKSLLFGIQALDPLTYGAVAVVLVVAAALASYVPARKTLAVDPVEALRSE